jgi:hypothetical protein
MGKLVIIAVILFLTSSCSSVTLQPVDFAWPVESVLTTDADGSVSIDRYSTSFNADKLFKTEFTETTNSIHKEIRVIRGIKGYYYITAPGFKHVYLFYVRDGVLIQEEKILITEEGMETPVFNQRKPDIELRNGGQVYLINNSGIIGEEK